MDSKIDKNNIAAQVLDQVQHQIDSFYYTQNADMVNNTDKINQSHALMADDESKRLYISEIAFLAANRVAPDVADKINSISLKQHQDLLMKSQELIKQHHVPNLKVTDKNEVMSAHMCRLGTFVLESYAYKDVVTVEKGDVVLDCGAYVGDTAIWAYQKGAKEVYSFEPCDEIIRSLKINLEDNNLPTDKFFQCAVGSINGPQAFLSPSDHHAGSTICGPADIPLQTDMTRVTCVRLDDFCGARNIQPSFIKMDIEGSEMWALQGAANLIKTYKPKLAICLYHKVSDMWIIPTYIHSLVPEYKFYCKKTHNLYDFVLFAKAE